MDTSPSSRVLVSEFVAEAVFANIEGQKVHVFGAGGNHDLGFFGLDRERG